LVLNGAFMVVSDFMSFIKNAEVSFIKMSSYEGISTNDVKQLIG
jgi:hypoxanthine-guanine phosphoribosyltransferase